MTLLPEGGAALPVSVTTTRKVQGGAAIPVYGYMTAPTDGRPAMGGSAIPVRVLTAADLKQNGGQWTLEGRPYAMPVYTAPAGVTVQGGPALAVYPVNAWPTVTPVTPPAFVPTDIAGLRLWLKADAGTWQDAAKTTPAVADADPVGAWADQSGNSNDVTQATAGNKPALKLAIQNGKPVIRFDGTNDRLITTNTFDLSVANALSLFVVAVTAVDGKYAFMWNDAVDGGSVYAGVGIGTAHKYGVYTAGRAPAGWNSGNTSVDTGAFFLIETVLTTTTLDLYLNGAADRATVNQAGTLASTTSYGVVGSRNDVGDFPWTGDIAEILWYNTGLSAANRAKVETYLNTRWAVY